MGPLHFPCAVEQSPPWTHPTPLHVRAPPLQNPYPSLSMCGRGCLGVWRTFRWNWVKSSFSGCRSQVAPLEGEGGRQIKEAFLIQDRQEAQWAGRACSDPTWGGTQGIGPSPFVNSAVGKYMLPKHECGPAAHSVGVPSNPICLIPTFKKGWEEKDKHLPPEHKMVLRIR